LKVLIVYIGLF